MTGTAATAVKLQTVQDDVRHIRRLLEGNGKPGLLDRVKEVEVSQRLCPARQAVTNSSKAVKMQIICTVIMVITAAITLAGFLNGINNG